MIWIAFAVLTGAAALSVLWPLSRRSAGRTRRETDIAFYEAQLAEIDRDLSRGLTSVADAEGARVQAGRRLLAVAQPGLGGYKASTWARRITAIGALLAIPAVALGLYVFLGSPDLPDEPLTARLNAPTNQMDLGVAVARIEAHLAQNPDDGRGWELLGPVYMRLGRPDDAARSFANAIRTLGDSADREQALGEALLGANDGQVTDKARQAFEAALRLDPKAPAPRFYLGLAAEQVGDKARAANMWAQLLADSPADAPWVPIVRTHLAALGVPTPPGASSPGPNAQQAAQVAALPADQQAAFIRKMVAGLAARLAQNGGDVGEWSRLVRAYTVLHEPDKARAALSDARRNLHGNPAALDQLSSLARQLGLDS